MIPLSKYIYENQVNESIKKVFKDFTDSLDAIEWLENDIRPGEYGIATVIIDGKAGNMTFGYDSTTASRRNDKNDAEQLYVHCTKLRGHFQNITDEYESMPRGEFADMVNDIIARNGD